MNIKNLKKKILDSSRNNDFEIDIVDKCCNKRKIHSFTFSKSSSVFIIK